jgi:hypothetical protein
MVDPTARLALDNQVSNELWSRAIAIAGLDTSYLISFDKLFVLSDLKKDVEKARDTCEKHRIGYTRKNGQKVFLRDVFGNMVKWINLFKEAGDVAIAYDPGVAALPWAMVRFLLQVCAPTCMVLTARHT